MEEWRGLIARTAPPKIPYRKLERRDSTGKTLYWNVQRIAHIQKLLRYICNNRAQYLHTVCRDAGNRHTEV